MKELKQKIIMLADKFKWNKNTSWGVEYEKRMISHYFLQSHAHKEGQLIRFNPLKVE